MTRFLINSLIISILSFGILAAGKNNFTVLGPKRIIYHKDNSTKSLPYSAPCLWKHLGLLNKEEVKKFISDSQLPLLCSEWKEMQYAKKRSLFSELFNHVREFNLEEEIRILWGETPLYYLSDDRIYSALFSLLANVKKKEETWGRDLAVHHALAEVEHWYSPVIGVNIIQEKEKEHEGVSKKLCPHCDHGKCCYYRLNALD